RVAADGQEAAARALTEAVDAHAVHGAGTARRERVVDAQFAQVRPALWAQELAARLAARERLPVGEHDLETAAAEVGRQRRTSRSGAEHQDVAVGLHARTIGRVSSDAGSATTGGTVAAAVVAAAPLLNSTPAAVLPPRPIRKPGASCA